MSFTLFKVNNWFKSIVRETFFLWCVEPRWRPCQCFAKISLSQHHTDGSLRKRVCLSQFSWGVLLFHCPTDVRLMFDRTNKSLSEEPSERLADESNDRNLTAGHEPSKDEEKMIWYWCDIIIFSIIPLMWHVTVSWLLVHPSTPGLLLCAPLSRLPSLWLPPGGGLQAHLTPRISSPSNPTLLVLFV